MPGSSLLLFFALYSEGRDIAEVQHSGYLRDSLLLSLNHFLVSKIIPLGWFQWLLQEAQSYFVFSTVGGEGEDGPRKMGKIVWTGRGELGNSDYSLDGSKVLNTGAGRSAQSLTTDSYNSINFPAEHAYFPKSRHCSSLGQRIHPRPCLYYNWLENPSVSVLFNVPGQLFPILLSVSKSKH